MTFSYINTEVIGKTGILTLNQPRSHNTLSVEMLKEIKEGLEGFIIDDAVRSIILTGNERSFSIGVDIKELESPASRVDLLSRLKEVEDILQNCKKPLIAGVSGYVLSSGLSISLLCDIILAADNSRFGYPEITLSMLPIDLGGNLLERTIGKSKAMEMILSGRNMDAVEAERVGLVSRIVPVSDLLADAIRTSERIASMSTFVVDLAKEALKKGNKFSFEEGIEEDRRYFIKSLESKDCEDSLSRYISKQS